MEEKEDLGVGLTIGMGETQGFGGSSISDSLTRIRLIGGLRKIADMVWIWEVFRVWISYQS